MELIEVYEGAMSEGWASGEGTLISKDGYRYTGSWKRSTQSGFGIAETSDGYKYEGNWENGKQHGWGTLIQPNGESISGEWVEGETCKYRQVKVYEEKNKIILAYSGGLDTSVILKWLQINYDAEVIPTLLILVKVKN